MPKLNTAQRHQPPRFDHAGTPLPGWAGISTLFGADLGSALTPPPEVPTWAVIGVPFDGTASSRPGAAEAPRAIRAASLIYSHSLESLGETDMTDMRTGQEFSYKAPAVYDFGDCKVYQTDIAKTFDSVTATTHQSVNAGYSPLLLGGDHSITFPAFAGFLRSERERNPEVKVGFINLDHHFDFGENSLIHGAIYHGSNSRRISELPGVEPQHMAFIGVGDVTRRAQLADLRQRGFNIASVSDLRQGGITALTDTLAPIIDECDIVYVSLDIDVADASVAPGTGNVTLGGLESGLLMDIILELGRLPLGGLDIMEVAPRYDPTGRTAQLAARLVYEVLFRQPVRRVGGPGASQTSSEEVGTA